MIKRGLIVVFSLLSFTALSAQEARPLSEGIVSVRNSGDSLPAVKERLFTDRVPALLQGIWQGEDRLLMFSDQNEFALVLRVFYQWYNDRAGESPSFSELKSRDRNDTTVSPAEDIQILYSTVCENPSKTAGVYELSVKYPGEKIPVIIPVCIIDGKLYLDFLIKDSAEITDFSSLPSSDNNSESHSSSDGFYRSASSASGITLSSPVFKKEVISYYVTQDGKEIYRIRYWLSEMDYSYAKATFSDGDKVFTVDKYLRIGSNTYQCTTGRSTKIRNIQKSFKFDKNAVYDSDGGIAAFGSPYLAKVPQGEERTSLAVSQAFLTQIEENNKKKKPAPPPLFPPSFPRFHWKEITDLELYNSSTWNKRNLDIHK